MEPIVIIGILLFAIMVAFDFVYNITVYSLAIMNHLKEILWKLIYVPIRLPLICLAHFGKWALKKNPPRPSNEVPRVPTHVDEPYHKRERGARVTTADNINEHYSRKDEEYIWLFNVKWPLEVFFGKVFHLFGLSGTGKSTVMLLLLMEFARLFFVNKGKKLRVAAIDPDGAYFNTCMGQMPDDVAIYRFTPNDAEGVAWAIADDIDCEEMAKLFSGTMFTKAMIEKTQDSFWLKHGKRVPLYIWRNFDYLKSDWRYEDMVIPIAYQQFLEPLLENCPIY